jgi:hypothetical protein
MLARAAAAVFAAGAAAVFDAIEREHGEAML